VLDEALNEEAEQDLVDLLAKQGEEVEGVEEVDGLPDDLPEDPAELRQLITDYQSRVGKRNKTIKRRSEANHRMQDEIDELKQQLASFQNQSTSASDVETQNQEREKVLESWRESANDDPGKAIDFAMSQIGDAQGKTVEYLAKMQQNFEDQIASLKGEMNPKRQKYREKIDQLKSNPRFSGFSDDQLETLAETLGGVKPPSTIGGKPVVATKTKEKRRDELRKQANAYFTNGMG